MKMRTGYTLTAGLLLILLFIGCSTTMDLSTIPKRRVSRTPAIPVTELPTVEREFPFPTYSQELTLIVATEQADTLEVTKEEIYGGKRLAFTSRWDDNSTVDYDMKELLSSYGVHGTFYLNAPYFNHATGTYSDTEDFTEHGQALVGDGFSIGSHSLSHPFISMNSRNRMFTEYMENRMLWESATDSPVVSVAFSFTDFRNDYEGDAVQRDLYRTMERSGLYHTATQNAHMSLQSEAIEFSPILPPDGLGDIALGYDFQMKDEKMLAFAPVSSLSMHSWGYDESDIEMLKAFLDELVEDETLWHCTQEEYAIYRSQFKQTRVEQIAAEDLGDGTTAVTYRITRPIIALLGGDTPLTIGTKGVQVITATLDKTPLSLYGENLIDLPHTGRRSQPAAIEYQGASALPEITTDLNVSPAGDAVTITITNGKEASLEALDLVIRLPLAWEEGMFHRYIPELAAGESHTETISLVLKQDPIYLAGEYLATAQIDFSLADDRYRFYRSTTGTFDDYQAADTILENASVLGPLPTGFPARDIERLFRYGLAGNAETAPSWFIASTVEMDWQDIDDTFLSSYPYLSPDYVPIRPNYFGVTTNGYLVRTMIVSETEQAVDIVADAQAIEHLILNGEEVGFHRVNLKQGENILFWYHKNPIDRGLTYASVGSYIKLEKPLSDERAEGITFKSVPASGEPFSFPSAQIKSITDRLIP